MLMPVVLRTGCLRLRAHSDDPFRLLKLIFRSCGAPWRNCTDCCAPERADHTAICSRGGGGVASRA